jgi:hypothetical protein
MKVKVDWMGWLKAIAKASVPFALGLLGGLTSGCSSLDPKSKAQSVTAFGIGVPAVVWVSNGTQAADNSGGDLNAPKQEVQQDVTGVR